jgi:regulator of cell morphogenesis and NO signaling
MTLAIDPTTTLGDLVTSHPDLASELERRSLDYCCGGTRTLADACSTQGLDPSAVVEELAAVATAEPAAWADLGAAELVDHLERTHHAYLHAELPRLAALSAKVRSVHGANHPELEEVDTTFGQLRGELDPHLAKEERVLFPMIRELARDAEEPALHCGSLQHPISQMLREHDQAGALLERLRSVTEGYTVPADGCASYRALYQALEQLESDTHLHVHIENNRLFPMVVELEQAASQ